MVKTFWEVSMYDIHCHILCGVDDGADTLPESVEMAEIACDSGT